MKSSLTKIRERSMIDTEWMGSRKVLELVEAWTIFSRCLLVAVVAAKREKQESSQLQEELSVLLMMCITGILLTLRLIDKGFAPRVMELEVPMHQLL